MSRCGQNVSSVERVFSRRVRQALHQLLRGSLIRRFRFVRQLVRGRRPTATGGELVPACRGGVNGSRGRRCLEADCAALPAGLFAPSRRGQYNVRCLAVGSPFDEFVAFREASHLGPRVGGMSGRFYGATAAVVVAWAVLALHGGRRGACCAGDGSRPQPPVLLGPAAGSTLAQAPGGAVDMMHTRRGDTGPEVVRRRSTDNGCTWSEPQTVLRPLPQGFGTPLPLLTRDGELQFFWLVARGSGRRPGVDRFIDIWNAHSSDGQTRWTRPQRIFEGYVGSINGMAQLDSGRIVVPFAYWVGDRPMGPPTGPNVTTVVYSDDGGWTWQRSPAKLTAPCHEGYNGSNYGACEPTILQLADGRVWMLIRTQTGWLYESFSPDGIHWSEPRPSRFRSSNSPGWLLRSAGGGIVLLWNNCENTSRVNGKGVYTNRDVLHAAISHDEGRTWRGYREICRDPFRDEPPPKRGDRGTAYPYAAATGNGMILCVTGQGRGRRTLVRIDPRWLEETEQEEDFSGGLEGWSVFTAFGEPVHWWRNRKQGAHLVDHPTRAKARCLHVRRADENPPDGAVWNFPAGQRGRLTLRLMLNKGFGGGSIGLADRFIQPTDDVGEKKVLFTLPIRPDGRLPDGSRLQPGQWHRLELAWDLEAGRCRVSVDCRSAIELAQSNDACAGVCYLRLRSTAEALDPAGFLVERVHVRVTP